MLTLRPYQQRAIDELYHWLSHNKGHPCIVMPTGSGKSLVLAALCKDALTQWKGTKILMLAARKELIEQNYKALKKLWPNAPAGIYSAGLKEKTIDAITIAGIQSLRGKVGLLGNVDLCLVDEADEINHKDEGVYRRLIQDLHDYNPRIRVIGFTATPYRTGHGLITDKPALFDDLIEPISIIDLQMQGFLSPLVSKHTKTVLDINGVHIRGGDYAENELAEAVDKELTNEAAVDEIIKRGNDRKAWLVFCSGVKHAEHIAACLNDNGINAACVTGQTLEMERDQILLDFKAGKIQAVTNANLLTVGFDYPNIDLIAMLRPTCSQRLYVQMAGRGLRIAEGKKDCLILDFAGNVERHGPITSIRLPKKHGEGNGVAPSKLCPECDEILPVQAKECPECGYVFPKEEKKYKLHDDDIMGRDTLKELKISGWGWDIQKSKKTGQDMIVCSYYQNELTAQPIREYFCVYHEGYAGYKALIALKNLCIEAGIESIPDDISELRKAPHPKSIIVQKQGNFDRIVSKVWDAVPF